MDQCRVLIVDDEEDTRDLLAVALQRDGLAVDTACNGAVALERLNEISYDVLVTDLVMPELDGIDLLNALNAQNSGVIKIVITSFADKDNVKSVLNAGADYLIEKPFNGGQLKAVIEYLYDNEDKVTLSREQDDSFSSVFQRRLITLPITDTEKRIVSLIARGASNETISEALSISKQTVKNRVSLIYRKLGISSRAEIFSMLFPI